MERKKRKEKRSVCCCGNIFFFRIICDKLNLKFKIFIYVYFKHTVFNPYQSKHSVPNEA